VNKTSRVGEATAKFPGAPRDLKTDHHPERRQQPDAEKPKHRERGQEREHKRDAEDFQQPTRNEDLRERRENVDR
jgi:hypothetical protein